MKFDFSPSSPPREETIWEKTTLIWVSAAGALAVWLGSTMVSTAATLSFVWCLGCVLVIGGLIALIPVFVMGAAVAIGAAVIAVVLWIIKYFATHIS